MLAMGIGAILTLAALLVLLRSVAPLADLLTYGASVYEQE